MTIFDSVPDAKLIRQGAAVPSVFIATKMGGGYTISANEKGRKGLMLQELPKIILSRLGLDGRDPAQTGAVPRVDAVAWSLLSLWRYPECRTALLPLARLLDGAQLSDGSVPIGPQFAWAAWPTPLAILAWVQQGSQPTLLDKAVQFLLHWHGQHYAPTDDTLGHDTSIEGWPWISYTHSWIEPTVMALLALRAVKKSNEPRCLEARKMILNRQLPQGGWNFGNTTVFGQVLRPMPHSTAMALIGLAGLVSEDVIGASLTYLQTTLPPIRSPLSLGWGILALAAWNRRPSEAEKWIEESLAAEQSTADYHVSLLCLLACASCPLSNNPLFRSVPPS